MLFVLGLADLMAGAVFLAQALGFDVPSSMVVFFAAYLVIKGGVFVFNSFDLGSFIDIMAGGILLAGMFLTLPPPLFIFFGGVLLIKGFLSLFA